MMGRRIAVGWWLVLGQATGAVASIGGGSNRIPLTDLLVELYNVTINVYVP
jgi:hypothetical protein